MRSRDGGTRAPQKGFVRAYRLVDAGVHDDVVAEAIRRYRTLGWEVLDEDYRILTQETRWQEVVLWVRPPAREPEEVVA